MSSRSMKNAVKFDGAGQLVNYNLIVFVQLSELNIALNTGIIFQASHVLRKRGILARALKN